MNETESFDQFCGEHFEGPFFKTIVLMLSVSVGVPASVWLLWMLSRKQHVGLSSDIYTVNLTAMDLVHSIIMIPFVLNYYVMKVDWVAAVSIPAACLSSCGRPLLMACICGDCLMAVVYPVQYMRLKDCSYKIVICALVWVITLAQGVVFVLDTTLRALWFIMPAIAVPIIVVCDIAILCVLRKPDPSGRNDVHPQKQRALQAITNSLILSIVSYLPPLVSAIISQLLSLSPEEILCNIQMPASGFALVTSTIMPLLHLYNLGTFQNLRRLWCHS